MVDAKSRLGRYQPGNTRGHLPACQKQCAFVLTQVEDDGIDGLALSGALSEIFPGLQTLFLPAYPTSAQRLEVADTKVFPEPIDGEGLLTAIARAQSASSGAPDLFHVAD